MERSKPLQDAKTAEFAVVAVCRSHQWWLGFFCFDRPCG